MSRARNDETPNPIRIDKPEFVRHALTMRPDWDARELEGALIAAGNNRPPLRSLEDHWAWTTDIAQRHLSDRKYTARDLLNAVRSPITPAKVPLASPVRTAALVAETSAAVLAATPQPRTERNHVDDQQ